MYVFVELLKVRAVGSTTAAGRCRRRQKFVQDAPSLTRLNVEFKSLRIPDGIKQTSVGNDEFIREIVPPSSPQGGET